MSVRDNKMAVLRRLGLESDPIGLPELMFRLGGGYKERSVRRWLGLLVKEGSVKKGGLNTVQSGDWRKQMVR